MTERVVDPGARHLRALDSEERDRLFEAGAGHKDRTSTLKLDSQSNAPLALLRVGPRDLPHALKAIDAGARPAALTSGIGEPPDFTARIHSQCSRRALSWSVDPLVFETALDGYRTKRHLQELEYTPAPGHRYSKNQLRPAARRRRLGRDVVGAELELGVGAFQTGGFIADGLADEYLAITRDLADAGIAARDASAQLPVLVQLPLRIFGFEEQETQLMLVRSIAALKPDAFLLMMDGVHEDSSAERLSSAIRLMLLLRATGSRVIMARPGDLRRLFLAFGVDGIEYGLGRFLRFAKPDYQRHGGQGPTPGPRFEIPSACLSLPSKQAERALDGDLIDEVDCTCPSCADEGDLDQRLARTPQHDAHIVASELRDLVDVPVPQRVSRLETDLRAASHICADLERNDLSLGSRRRLERWLRAIEIVAEAGLLNPATAEEALELD